MWNQIKKFIWKVSWIIKNYSNISETRILINNNFLGPILYNSDSIATSNNCDFINEPRFNKAYGAAAATNPWPGFTLQWRVYIVCWFADMVKDLEGDFVECGVNTGAYARAVIDYIDFNSTDKIFYLLDTFEGFPIEQITSKERAQGLEFYAGNHYKNVYEQVKETFNGFNVKIIKGRVPDTLVFCTSEKIVFLSIDMNAVLPEIAAASYFWDKLVKGGVVILDDYGFPMHIEQKKAFDEFAKNKNVEILSLPTGQAIILKK